MDPNPYCQTAGLSSSCRCGFHGYVFAKKKGGGGDNMSREYR